MIYLFNQDKSLYTDYPIIPEDSILSLPEKRQINGLWTVSADLLVEGLYHHVDNSAYIGFYDADKRFQLYKIIDLRVSNDVFTVDAVYLFHDEAYSGEVIRDRRFIDRQADVAAIAAFEPIGWTMDGHDLTDEKTTNFYYISPLEALARIEEVWGVEFNFWIVFDGQKILGKYYEMRNRIGKFGNKIYEYNENISNITHTQSRQDIVTAVLPRGRGEELEEGTFGRSIQIDDVVWSKASGDPLDKPAGQDYLEIPEMTALWGYDGVKPRIRKVDFSNEEDPEQLIKLAHEWLLENSVPKSVFKLQVADGQSHDLGDTVGVSYKAINLTSYTRVFEVERDHKTGRVIVEFGDVELKSDRRISSIRNDIERIESNNSRVVELQQQFNSMFDAKVRDMEQEFEQALIDAHAEIAAIDENMKTEIANEIAEFEDAFNSEVQAAKDLAAQQIVDTENRINTTIDTTRTEMEDAINSEVQAAKDLAEQQIVDTEKRINTTIDTTRTEIETEFNAEVERIEQEALAEYGRISDEITDTIDQARNEIEQDYNQAVINAREYAEQQAEQHANAVDSKLETMRGVHADLIQQNQNDIADVNDFIGSQTSNLSGILQTLEQDFDQKLARETWHYNLLRGTQFDEDFWSVGASTHGAIFDDEPINYWHYNEFSDTDTSNMPYIQTSQSVEFTEGVRYRLSFDVQTYGMKIFDYMFIIADDGSGNSGLAGSWMTDGNVHNIPLGSQWRRAWLEFIPTRSMTGFIRIGTRIVNNPHGRRSFKIRRPYLTESENIQWLYHLDDNMQNLEEITMRVNELETGFETLITRTEFDNITGQIDGTIRSITDTVDGVEDTIQNHENWILTNGSSIERTVDGFDSKVWLSDIHNPNMLSYTDITLVEHRRNWTGWNTNVTGPSYNEFMRVRNTDSTSHIGIISSDVELVSGMEYTLSWVGFIYGDSVIDTMNYTYVFYPGKPNQGINSSSGTRTVVPTIPGSYGDRTLYKYTRTFTARHTGPAQIMIGGYTASSGIDASFSFKEPKLELGNRATPYYTAFSGLTQRVDEISLLVQEIDGGVVRQSDITVSPSSVRIGSTEILGDDVLSSVLNVSPNAIDMITKKMRLSGDLYVDGDITALAVKAVEGNFSRLWADEFDAVTITGEHIEANSINVQHLTGADGILNYLMARLVFSDKVSALSLEAVEANIGRVRTSLLTANVITSDMIQSSNATIDKLFSSDARIDRLVTKAHFTDQIHTMSLSAVEGEFARLWADEFDAVTITGEHIEANSINVQHLTGADGILNYLMARLVFSDKVSALSLDVVEGNFATLFASEISTTNLNASNITTGTLSSARLQVNDALINRLISNSILTNEMTARSVDAIEGNFANLFASEISTVNLNASNITTGTLSSARLQVNNALINRLISNSILTNEMTARSIEAINGRFASLFASEISTVNLNASNITTGTLSSARLQVNNALINRLISNSILTSEMRTQSLTAVRGDIADLRTRILTSDVITSTHISSSNALIDKLFASSALISRLTSKSAFISQLRTIDLAAEQVRVGFNGISSNVTINSSGITIDRGALTVHRRDGGVPTIIGGHNPSGVHLVPSTPNRRDSTLTIEGQYVMNIGSGINWKVFDFYMFEHFYTDVMVDFAIFNTTNSEMSIGVRIRGTDGSTFSRSKVYTVPAGTAIFPRLITSIGKPDGSVQRFFLETTASGGTSGKYGVHTYIVKHLDNGHGYPRLEI